MTTILIPSGKSFTAPEDIVFPIVTTVVPDSASSSDISVVAKADLAKVFPVKTIERFVEKDNALYTGDIAPVAIAFVSAPGNTTTLLQGIGRVFGRFEATDGSMTIEFSPVTGKATLVAGEVTLVSQEAYDSVENIGTLTFKTSVGGVETTYGTATPSAEAKFVTRVSGEIRGTPIPSTASLVANHQAKGVSSVKTDIVIPNGAVISHNAPNTAKVYLTF